MLFSMCVVQRLPVMVAVYLLRGSMQNAVNPLTRSIIMDFTKSNDPPPVFLRCLLSSACMHACGSVKSVKKSRANSSRQWLRQSWRNHPTGSTEEPPTYKASECLYKDKEVVFLVCA